MLPVVAFALIIGITIFVIGLLARGYQESSMWSAVAASVFSLIAFGSLVLIGVIRAGGAIIVPRSRSEARAVNGQLVTNAAIAIIAAILGAVAGSVLTVMLQ